MRRTSRKHREAVWQALAETDAWPDGRGIDDALVEDLVVRLRDGMGEEPLVERLASSLPHHDPEALIALARALLKIGIRPRGDGWRARSVGPDVCTICESEVPFCWACPCGFRLCQACMDENLWGLTCNNVTWECPDCGGFRAY